MSHQQHRKFVLNVSSAVIYNIVSNISARSLNWKHKTPKIICQRNLILPLVDSHLCEFQNISSEMPFINCSVVLIAINKRRFGGRYEQPHKKVLFFKGH